MRTVKLRLYDRQHQKFKDYEEIVYAPDDENKPSSVHWRRATIPGQWVKLDDGGVCRLLRINPTINGITWLTTPCGDAVREWSKTKIMSTGLRVTHRSCRSFNNFVELENGMVIPEKVKIFCDALLAGHSLLVAAELVGSRNVTVAKWTDDKKLKKYVSRHITFGRKLLERYDSQEYIKMKLSDDFDNAGFDMAGILRKIDRLLDDTDTPANVKRDLLFKLLDYRMKDNEDKSSDGEADVGINHRGKIVRMKRRGDRCKDAEVVNG